MKRSIKKHAAARAQVASEGNKERITVKRAATVKKCSHCGGVIKDDGALESCVMCGRQSGHHCDRCLFNEGEHVAV